jgi:hypothetical protein
VWGHDDLDRFIAFADGIHLDGVAERIAVPFLIAHGEKDRQIPLEYAPVRTTRPSIRLGVNSAGLHDAKQAFS